jgi:ABC-type glycerol-3-phosphate transport system substrate-binding protein
LVELDLAMLGAARSYVLPLDEFVSTSGRALFSEEAWKAATDRGRICFVPHRLMWQAMMYNRIEVPNPPDTWNDLARFARAHPGKLALKFARYEGAVCDALPFVWATGGSECEPDSIGTLRAFGFLKLIEPDLNDASAKFREMSVLEAQARGSVWIHLNWPFAIEYLHAKGLAPNVDLSAPIPAGPYGRATPLGGGYLAIPVSAPHPNLAAEFIEYLLTPASQLRLSRELGWYGSVPPRAGTEQARLHAGFTVMRPHARARPAVDCYAELSDRWRRAIRATVLDDKSPAEAFAQNFKSTAASSPASDRCACPGASQ